MRNRAAQKLYVPAESTHTNRMKYSEHSMSEARATLGMPRRSTVISSPRALFSAPNTMLTTKRRTRATGTRANGVMPSMPLEKKSTAKPSANEMSMAGMAPRLRGSMRMSTGSTEMSR